MAGSKRSNSGKRRNDSNSLQTGRSTDGGESTSSGRDRRVVIKPLSTVGDRGTPSKSISKDMQRVINLIQDERHLVAYELYLDCKGRLRELREKKKRFDEAQETEQKDRTKSAWMSKKKKICQPTFNTEEFDAAVELVQKHKEDFLQLEKRAKLFKACRDNMDESEGWTLAQTLFGVTTYYRREEDGSLSIKLEGELKDCPLFDQVAVLREIDLHYLWAPFVTSSLTLSHLDKLDTVGWFMVGLPHFGIARDACFRAIGCDCVEEDQSVLIVGRGVEDRVPGTPPADEESKFLSEASEIKSLDVPPVPTRLGSGRLTMKMFEAKIRVMAPDHIHTYILANIDPNLAFIPQSLLEFVMKKLCGLILNKLQACAKKITKDPIRNVHAQRMRDEAAFYRDWLLPKFRNVCAEKGWDVPEIAAFDLSQAQQVEAQKILQKRANKAQSFSQFDSGNSTDDGPKSARSTPNLYHSKPLDSKDDDDSDISSLSGTSQSIWKNNPIASYLREIETRTQERKDKEVQESRRKAAARLRPKPLPIDKKERLQQLKDHKYRKKASRQMSSSGSIDGCSLAPVDENDTSTVVTGATGVTSRSVPYSPISAALKDQGRWPRLCVVSGLVLLLFILLHGDEFLPDFSSVGDKKIAFILRDSVALVYMVMCGIVHFFLCDVQLIYAFEAFELGRKSGEQVKTFYRGQIRVLVAAASGLMVSVSVGKAVIMAGIRAAIFWVLALYDHWMTIYSNVATAISEETQIATERAVLLNDSSVEIGATDLDSAAYYSVIAALCNSYAYAMSWIHSIFNWQLRVFVRSNFIGRTLESMMTGAYSWWLGLLTSTGNNMYARFTRESEPDSPDLSWRDDAIATLRGLLCYTSVLLLAICFLLNFFARGYRHKPPRPNSPRRPSISTMSASGESGQASLVTGGKLPKRVIPQSRSMDSGTKRRFRFLPKRNEKMDDDSL